jgi:ABC-2 type transport system ATP-binding protein
VTTAISVSGLTKSFGASVALDGLELSVGTGEVHGFLGPNGAGKSTTIRVLLGLLRADGGTARLLGGDPWRDATALHRRLAYVPGDVTLWPNLTGGEVIDLLGRLRGGIDAGRRARMIERFELDPAKKGRAYSKGNRQKVALIAALASDVELLILDEPTSGLDPLMEETFRDCIREECQSGRTVLLSSHLLDEVEALCERVTIIGKGRTVDTGTLAELRHVSRTSVIAELARPFPRFAELPGVHDCALAEGGPVASEYTGNVGSGSVSSGNVSSGNVSSGNGNVSSGNMAAVGGTRGYRVSCQVEAGKLGEVLRQLSDHGVLSLVSRPPTLEELFIRHYSALTDPAVPDTAVTHPAFPDTAVTEPAVKDSAVTDPALPDSAVVDPAQTARQAASPAVPDSAVVDPAQTARQAASDDRRSSG